MESFKESPAWEDMLVQEDAPPVSARSQGEISPSYLTHELRAPVTAIRLGLEILQDQLNGRLSADERHMLSLAFKNTIRLEALVNDVMDYSKIAAGKMPLKKEPCSPQELIKDAVEILQPSALSAAVKLIQEKEDPLPRVSAEGRRIVQMLSNLVSNAIKYVPPRGRGVVRVSAALGKFEHAGTVVFKVKDNGCGIALNDLEKLFSAFSQTESKNQKSGTGLGLALVRAMAELHGGRVWAESWPGAGSSFYFSIPIAREDLREEIDVYPKPVEYSGLVMAFAKRMNAVLAFFV
ncbi:MAG TPA: HAMP domain-containing sensor histidine kinase [Elusimicrobiota bacterium]|nr:HAMP domain-containing sensor histidine kinase [Elusimicrobiota bacterium]